MTALALNSEVGRFTHSLYNSYEAFKVKELTSRRLKHAAMMNILVSLQTSLNNILRIEQIGRSSEGRSINLLSLGRGKTKVFMWTQMHGDEPTATMGLLDMLSYIGKNQAASEVKKILSDTTLLIIPMLNPDGAERFQRRSVHGIDINRDALRLQTIEARILKQTREKYAPEFGFNLHDQEPRYTVGSTGKVATIALLAPTYDYAKSENEVRHRAKQIAAALVDIFSPFIEGHISRYDDSFEARAFGDNIQKWGTSTVLIESGGSPDDPEKMSIRKINCVALLGICYSIATGAYEQADISRYERLLENTKNLYDVIIRGIQVTFANGVAPVIVDIGINTEESIDEKGMVQQKNRIVDIGDLSLHSSFKTINAEGKLVDGGAIVMDGVVDLAKLVSGLKGS
ncbi:MAG: M14 family zinc carboxypeptidase [Bacteroidota bacterium]